MNKQIDEIKQEIKYEIARLNKKIEQMQRFNYKVSVFDLCACILDKERLIEIYNEINVLELQAQKQFEKCSSKSTRTKFRHKSEIASKLYDQIQNILGEL